MQLFGNVNIDFMKWKRHFVIVSTVLNLFGIGIFAYQYLSGNLNVGIDFKGGTEIQVRFAKMIEVGDVRQALDEVGLKGASVTTIGDPRDSEIYIRLPLQSEETQVLMERVKQALAAITGAQAPVAGILDLNVADEKMVADFLVENGKFAPEESRAAAAAISEYKKGRGGIIQSSSEIASLPGINPQIMTWLTGKSSLAPFSIRSQNSVEGAVSRELAKKAFYAVAGSMLIMLIYIWFRFRFQWGLGAIVASVHDVIVTLGIFCVLGREWSIPVIAAFLTLTGYSMNDTIVVFDRIRENLRKKGGGGDLEKVVNASINQTLSRTIITSGLTWIVVVALFLLGGEVLNGFAFVLLVGIIVGTYSSIFIASPIIIYWDRLFARKPEPARARARA